MAIKKSLNADDWIKAGFRALTAGGHLAIKVEPIARELRVSKGSFYWHFKDVAALKVAMLQHWADVATGNVIESVGDGGTDPAGQLKMLVEIATSAKDMLYGGALAEAAIRDWARYDSATAATLKIVDDRRLQFLRELFEATGAGPARAGFFANVLYAALIGLEHLSYQELADRNRDLAGLLDLMLQDCA